MDLYDSIYAEVRKHLTQDDADLVARRLSTMSREDALALLKVAQRA